MGAEMIRADLRTDMMKLTVAFRSYENAPDKVLNVCERTLNWNSKLLWYEALYLINGYWDTFLNVHYAKFHICMQGHLATVPHYVHTKRHIFVNRPGTCETYQLYWAF